MIVCRIPLILSRSERSSSRDVLAEHRSQRRLGDLGCRVHVVLDLHDRGFRLDDPEVRNGVDANGHVVLGDHFLRRDVQRHRAELDLLHLVHERDQEEQAGPLGLGQKPAEAEDDAALVLARDLHRREQKDDEEDDDDSSGDQCDVHGVEAPSFE